MCNFRSPIKLLNCIFLQNSATAGGALYNDDSSSIEIHASTFTGNDASSGGGILNNNSSNPIITNSILSKNSVEEIVDLRGSISTVTSSIVLGGWHGSDNLDVNPLFNNSADPDGPDNRWATADDGLRPTAASPAISSGNLALLPTDIGDVDGDANVLESLPLDLAMNPRVRGGQVDRGAYEPLVPLIFYVRAGGRGAGFSWGDAAGDLQQTIEACASSGSNQVWVAAGTFKPNSWPNGGTGTREMHFSLRNGVSLFGGFPPTGTPGFTDRNPSMHVTRLSADIGTTGDLLDNTYQLFYHPATSGLNASARIDGCHLSDCADGLMGAMHNISTSPTVVRCVFENNSATQGSAIFLQSSSSVVTNCVFVGNSGSNNGAVMCSASQATFVNCVFYANSSAMGAFRTIGAGWNLLVNSSFTGNAGPALRIDATQPTSLINSVFWGNSGGDVSGTKTPIAHYCLFSTPPSLPGDGNFAADPQWVNTSDPDGPDGQWGTADDGLRLQLGSPALNSGKASMLPPDVADLDGDGNTTEPVPVDLIGQNRTIDGLPEIGAYEFLPAGMSLEYWRTLHYSGAIRSDPTKQATHWGSSADPDGDSVPNSGEYKLLLNPKLSDNPLAGARLVDRFGGKWMRIEYTLGLDRPGVSAFLETITTLATGPWRRSGYFSTVLNSTPTTETWEFLVPATPAHGFARLAFTTP